MANVGSLWVSLGLNSAAFTSGRKKANRELQALSNSVKSIHGLMVAGLATIGATATIGAAKAFVGAQMDIIDATAKAADRLGIQTEELIGYRHAANLAGVGAEEFDKSLEKMTRSIGQASQIGGAARDAIERLGLSAEELASKSPAAALADIADKIKEIKNPAERAAIAADIFGRSGQKLQNVLMGGSEALRLATEETKKLGTSFSRVDAAQVEAANDAFTRAGEVIRGVGVQLAVGLSPYLTAATNQFIELTTAGGGIGTKVTGGLESVASAVAKVSDFIELGKAAFYGLQAGWTYGIGLMVRGANILGTAITSVINLIPSLNSKLLEFTGAFADELEASASIAADKAIAAFDKFESSASGEKVKAAFDKIRSDAKAAGEAIAAAAVSPIQAIDHEAVKAADKITGVLASLQKDIDTFGMSSGDKKLFDLQAMGASPEQLSQARKAIDQYSALEAAQKKQQDSLSAAASIFDSTRTPMEQYESQIGKLNDLLANGVLSWDTYGRAIRKAREELEGGKTGRSATLGERIALTGRGGLSSSQSVGGQRAAAGGGNGKIKVDGTDKQIKILESIDAGISRINPGLA